MIKKKPISVEIGKRIQATRKSRGLSQSELSVACGWGNTASRVSNYESGAREPSTADFLKMSKSLNCLPESLQYGSKNGKKIQISHPLFTLHNLADNFDNIKTLNEKNWKNWENYFVANENEKDLYIIEITNDLYGKIHSGLEKGRKLVVSASKQESEGMFCIYLHTPSNTVTIRQYVKDGDHVILRSVLNKDIMDTGEILKNYRFFGKVIVIYQDSL